MNNDRETCQVNRVGGARGPQEIADLWKVHFHRLHSANVNSKFCALFREKLSCMAPSIDARSCLFSVSDIFSVLANQKRGKAPGPDGINMEAFQFGGNRLKLYLTILCNMFVLYGYVPVAFCQATIIPLVKCKSGDLTDTNNYRAIALSNAITKILESLLFFL